MKSNHCQLLIAFLLICSISCKREERSFHVAPPFAQMSQNIPYNNRVRPGPPATSTSSTTLPIDVERASPEPQGEQFIHNAQALSDGQTLYAAYNCSGCHAHGGGGMGPPLLDNKWF